MVNKPDVSDVRKLKSIVVASDIASCLNLRVQSGCRVLNLLDQAGHVLEEEVVKVLLLHVLELEHGLAGGLGGHGDGAAEVSLCCVTEAATVCPTLTLASVPGQYELTRGCNNTS